MKAISASVINRIIRVGAVAFLVPAGFSAGQDKPAPDEQLLGVFDATKKLSFRAESAKGGRSRGIYFEK